MKNKIIIFVLTTVVLIGAILFFTFNKTEAPYISTPAEKTNEPEPEKIVPAAETKPTNIVTQPKAPTCKILVPSDKTITSIDCVIGHYSPGEVIAYADKLDGKSIEISGTLSMQPVLVEQTPGGPVPMPTGGPAFHTTDGNIYMNSAAGLNAIESGTKVTVRGIFRYRADQRVKGQYAQTYFLQIPVSCQNCVSK